LKKKEKQINEMLLEKIETNDKMKAIACKTLLEKKLNGASPKLRSFLESRFEGTKSAKEIEEKFDEAVKAFNKDEARRRTQLVEKQKATIKPKQMKIEESVEHRGNNEGNDMMSNYVRQIETNTF
jgi:hypothetical protein